VELTAEESSFEKADENDGVDEHNQTAHQNTVGNCGQRLEE